MVKILPSEVAWHTQGKNCFKTLRRHSARVEYFIIITIILFEKWKLLYMEILREKVL